LPLIALGIDGLDALRRLARPLLEDPQRAGGRSDDSTRVAS
jgi:hypothetical protein